MSLAEQVERVLAERPELIVKALESRLDLLHAILAKLAPWDRLAAKEDVKMLIELMDRRFEDVNRRFEDMNRRFEDVNHRFEDMKYYVDRRVGLLEKLIIGLNIPILAGIITTLIKLFL